MAPDRSQLYIGMIARAREEIVAESDGALGRDVVVEVRVAISPAGLLSIAAIVLAGAVVTGVAIREAKRPGVPRLKADRNGSG